MTNPSSEPRHGSSTSETDCPSDLVFDLLLAGDLDAAGSSAVHEHLSTCAACSARFSELSTFRDEVGPTLPSFSKLVAAGSRTAQRTRTVVLTRRVAGWAGGILAMAAAVALWVGLGPSRKLPSDDTRAKGSARLGFYVKRGDRVFRGGPGEILKPGDAIEFSYAAPSAGYLAVLSVDGAGDASVYFPSSPRAQALMPGAHVLPQSTTLDAVLGRETLYALWCEAPVELEPIRRALESSPARPPLASGCRVESLEVEKRLP